MWKAFNRETRRCTVPHYKDGSRVCNELPEPRTGTSGEIKHLEKYHHEEWLHIKMTGEWKSSRDIIKDALGDKTYQSVLLVSEESTKERWIAKCNRPQSIIEDKERASCLYLAVVHKDKMQTTPRW